jgi:hypothetical protein
MDFTWVTTDDANAIQNSIVNAKGDLIGASANDTPAILSVGANGETLVADSSTSTGLRYQSNFAAGKNKIINGDFGIWQRGTSFSFAAAAYTSDRFIAFSDAGGTVSRSTFTPGTAPVSGYEGQFFMTLAKSAGGSYGQLFQKVEDVRTFAGQTVTLSFWAKAGSAQTFNLRFTQNFGSGGSASVFVTEQTVSVTTSWARYSATFTIPSISGKTIGTNSFLEIQTYWLTASALTVDTWGWQVEASNTATAFQTATGTLQGELSAAQRYYYRLTSTATFMPASTTGVMRTTTIGRLQVPLPVTMRVAPTTLDYSGLSLRKTSTDTVNGITTLTLDNKSTNYVTFDATIGSALTVGDVVVIQASTNEYWGVSAEL